MADAPVVGTGRAPEQTAVRNGPQLDFSLGALGRLVVFLTVVAAVLTLMGLMYQRFFIFNGTASEKIGFYLLCDDAPVKGDFVLLPKSMCPLQDSWIPESMLKNIRAVAGDRVAVSDDGVYINAQFVGPRPLDPKVKPFSWVGTVPEGKVFLLAPASRSFDSRHYGVVSYKGLRKVTPVVVW